MSEFFTISNVSPNKAAQIFSHITLDKTTGCWLWNGCVNWSGYGYTSFHHKTVYIHRFIYAWLIKPIPSGNAKDIQVLDHLCNNRICCNPAHLILILPKANVLRTDAPPSLNAKKTLCKRGHEFVGPHPITGKRRCYECAKLRRQIKSFGPRQHFFASPKDGS